MSTTTKITKTTKTLDTSAAPAVPPLFAGRGARVGRFWREGWAMGRNGERRPFVRLYDAHLVKRAEREAWHAGHQAGHAARIRTLDAVRPVDEGMSRLFGRTVRRVPLEG